VLVGEGVVPVDRGLGVEQGVRLHHDGHGGRGGGHGDGRDRHYHRAELRNPASALPYQGEPPPKQLTEL